jgi:hypothetical protein
MFPSYIPLVDRVNSVILHPLVLKRSFKGRSLFRTRFDEKTAGRFGEQTHHVAFHRCNLSPVSDFDTYTINTTTSAFTSGSSLIGPRLRIYGPDGAIYVGIAIAGGIYWYAASMKNK